MASRQETTCSRMPGRTILLYVSTSTFSSCDSRTRLVPTRIRSSIRSFSFFSRSLVEYKVLFLLAGTQFRKIHNTKIQPSCRYNTNMCNDYRGTWKNWSHYPTIVTRRIQYCYVMSNGKLNWFKKHFKIFHILFTGLPSKYPLHYHLSVEQFK